MESLFPAPFWEVLYGSHLQGNLSFLSTNHSLLPPHLLLNTSHGAFLPLGLKVTIVGLYLAVCAGGLLGNCLVMYVILRHTKMKTATNIYIFNLALADALVLLTLPFQGTDILLGFWPFGNALCKTVIAIDYYNMFTSTLTLTAMSVDRYVAICHPIRALDVRTSSKAQAVNVAIWVLASIVGIPVAIMGSAQAEEEASWSGGCAASACSRAPARRIGTCGASRGWCSWWWPCSWAAGRPCRSSCWSRGWASSRAVRPPWPCCASARRSATSTAASTQSSTPSWTRTSRPASAGSAARLPCVRRGRHPTACAASPGTRPWPARPPRWCRDPRD
ncbi:nociceptin receptor isoform X2 [Choloepus didactylus]|uniref:nociceptin receptor isoform X2 n=1 Tax=Choloepus didactylus TaxID=27675 RepID=UPI00189D074B|nr:nociceptin receptor isoform X2 [Choloepus didactylus]